MMALRCLILAALLAPTAGLEVQQRTASAANPIRKVVTMLQMMVKKIEAQGEKEQELFEKYMCYCKNADATLGKSIEEAKNKIPQLESSIKEAAEKKAQFEQDLENHKADRAAAKEAMAKATEIREKEAAEFAKENAETMANLDAMTKAIAAIEKGMAGGFLQSNAASVLRRVVVSKVQMLDADRQELVSFLSGTQSDGYAPASGEIVGILKQLKDEMEKDIAEVKAAEDAAIAAYDELMAAKTKEVETLTKAIEEKLQRVGELGVELAEMKNDLEDTQEGLAEDQKFLADLAKNCALREKEWDQICKTRSEELLALADTIKILNDDDALELFKKTALVQKPSFIQLESSDRSLRARALSIVRAARKSNSPQLDFIALALRGKKVGFEKVITLIDEMVVVLKKEQVDDDNKKEYCLKELDLADDKKKATERLISDHEKAIAETEEALATITEEVKALEDGIKALDKSVAVATEQRKEENADYTTNMAQNSAAKELILFAKNRMQKFYNPKLYKPPPKRELTEEERITLNMGGTLAPTNPPAGIAGTGIGLVQAHVAPPPPPEAPKAYSKKSEESGGVLAMMDMMVSDLEKEITQFELEEKDAQEEYEEFMGDSADKRAQDSKSLTEKGAAKAEAETALQASTDAKKASETELKATLETIQALHTDCDFLLEFYQMRKEARAGEIDAMGKAKAVLNGADYSLVQTASAVHLRGVATAKKCGPNTKLHVSQSENAAGTPIYQEIEGIVDGTCMFRGNPTMKSVKFCGPGTLTLSRMSCERHDYKALTIEHPGSEWTTNCEVINAEGTIVEGYFGSLTIKC